MILDFGVMLYDKIRASGKTIPEFATLVGTTVWRESMKALGVSLDRIDHRLAELHGVRTVKVTVPRAFAGGRHTGNRSAVRVAPR